MRDDFSRAVWIENPETFTCVPVTWPTSPGIELFHPHVSFFDTVSTFVRSLPLLSRLVTYRSIIDLPFVQERVLNPDQILEISEVARLGDLNAKNVAVVAGLGALAHTSEESFYSGDETAIVLGDVLRLAVKTRQDLWLSAVEESDVAHIQDILGESVVHRIGPASSLMDAPGTLPSALDMHPQRTLVPIAVSPNHLVQQWARGTEQQRTLLAHLMEGTDTLIMRRKNLQALRSVGASLMERYAFSRYLSNPKVIAYLIVLVYSSLRALPVMFVEGFHGNIWTLWGIDILTAIPYTWGVVEMFAGRSLRRRIAGMIVTFTTFTSPYVYFWMNGHGYPVWVNIVIAVMIIGAFAIEYARWLRDQAVRRIIAEPARGTREPQGDTR